jgi:trigger factor
MLSIVLSAEEVQQEYDKVVAVYKKHGKIPGFRPGKAPEAVVRNKFKTQIAEDVKERLIPEGYHKAIEEKELDVVAILGVQNVEFEVGKPMKFEVLLDVPPKFKLPKYKGITVKGESVEVGDDEIEKAIDGLRERFASYDDIEDRPLKKGDLAKIDYKGTLKSEDVETLAPEAVGLGAGTDFWTAVDENAFLPGFADGLDGMKIGENKQITVEFAKDFAEPAVAGKKVSYQVELKGIREKVLPPLDESLLEKFGVKTEEELRKQMREEMERMAKQREDQRRKNEIIKHLMKKASFDLPESVVQSETRNSVYDLVRQHSAQGVSEDDIESKKEEIFETATRNAQEKVKLRYILHEIAEAEDVQVSREAVDEHIAGMARGYGMEPEAVRAELQKRNALDNLKEDLRMSRTLDKLLEEATIK